MFISQILLKKKYEIFFSFRRNIQDTTNFTCRFDGTAHTADCPIIPVGFILDRLKTNKTALLIEVTIVQ